MENVVKYYEHFDICISCSVWVICKFGVSLNRLGGGKEKLGLKFIWKMPFPY